jgi:hypothetical protein
MKYFHHFNQALTVALGVVLLLMGWRWYAPILTVTSAQTHAVFELCRPLPDCNGVRMELRYDAANRHYFPLIRVYPAKDLLKGKSVGENKQLLHDALLTAYQAHVSHSFSPLRLIQQRAQVEVQP